MTVDPSPSLTDAEVEAATEVIAELRRNDTYSSGEIAVEVLTAARQHDPRSTTEGLDEVRPLSDTFLGWMRYKLALAALDTPTEPQP